MFRRLSALILITIASSGALQAQSGRTPQFREVKAEILAAIAQRKPSSEVVKAIRALSRFRDPQARKLLLNLWDTQASHAVRIAILGQFRNHKHATVRKLLEAQFKTNPKTRSTAASALVGQGKPGINLLVAAAGSDDEELQKAALTALGSARGNKLAAQALEHAVRTASGDVQYRALVSLRNQEKDRAMLRMLAGLLQSKTVTTRAEALRQLAAVRHKAARRALVAMTRDAELIKAPLGPGALTFALAMFLDDTTLPLLLRLHQSHARYVINEMRSLARNKDENQRVAKALARAVRNGERPEDRMSALALLEPFALPVASEAIASALDDPSPRVIVAAVETLGRRKDTSVTRRLDRLLDSDNVDLRLTAMLALHAIRKNDGRWPTRLLQELAQPSLAVRLAALDLLIELRCRRAIEPVLEFLSSDDWQLRSAAVAFFAKVRDKRSIPILIERLPRESGRLRFEILHALESLTHKSYPKPEYWARWWLAEGDRFELPRVEKTQAKTSGKPAVVTFYGIPIETDRASFVIDTSGSMAQKAGTAKMPKIEAAKRALQQVIKHCRPEVKFNLIPFATAGRPWQNGIKEASEDHRTKARDFVRTLRAGGGTNVYDAMRLAFSDPEVDTIYLLSDGAPSVGEIVNVQRLADAIRRWNRTRRIVIHTISIGTDSVLLQRLAAESGGTYRRWI